MSLPPRPVLEPNDDAHAAAAGWVARLTAAPPSPDTRAAFQAWIAAAPEHRPAYDLARRAFAEAERLAPRPSASQRMTRRIFSGAGAAMAAGLVALVLMPSLETFGADVRTAPGQVRTQLLEDGTRLWLDTDSAVDVRYDGGSRTIDLRRGRLFVEVAPGDARPFAVRTEGALIRDIGTGFSVDRAGKGFRVAVESGVVDVSAHGRVDRLTAGQDARFGAAPVARKPLNRDDLAWRNRQIVFERKPLRAAIAEIGRYRSDRVVWLAGDDDTPVSGLLRLDRLDEGLQTLAADHGLDLIKLPGLTFVVKKS